AEPPVPVHVLPGRRPAGVPPVRLEPARAPAPALRGHELQRRRLLLSAYREGRFDFVALPPRRSTPAPSSHLPARARSIANRIAIHIPNGRHASARARSSSLVGIAA